MTLSDYEPPEGFVLFGWHKYNGGGLSAIAQLSAAHLAEEHQTEPNPSFPDRRRNPYLSLCGLRTRARVDTPTSVKHDVRTGQRKLCTRCEKKAAAREQQ